MSPYYVGKGQGKRCFQNGGRNCRKPTDPQRIRKVFQSDDEDKVLEVERTLIHFYGRKCEGGILQNISEGGQNPPDLTGYKREDTSAYREAAIRTQSWKRWGKGGAKPGNHNRKPIPILVDGIVYPHAAAAAKVIGITPPGSPLSGQNRQVFLLRINSSCDIILYDRKYTTLP